MDKQILVERAERLLTNLRLHGVETQAYRWSPVYTGSPNASYRLGIVAPALQNKSGRKTTQFLTERIFDIFEPGERGKIYSILSYDTVEEMNEDLDEREGVGRPVVEPYWPD